MENISSIEKVLKEKGYKLTKQRSDILSVIYKENTHLSAEEIYARLKKNNIGLATVYRTLNLLTDLNILKEVKINEMSYYEPKMFSKKSLHIHFKCDKCNTIFDIDSDNIAVKYLKINRLIEKENNVIVNDVDILLNGICEKCRNK